MPQAAVRYAEAEMHRLLNAVAAQQLVGYSSLAVGADQQFAQMVLTLGGRLRLVIPSADYSSTFTNDTDLAKYERLLSEADSFETLDFPGPSEQAFLAAGKVVVDRCDVLLAVWDGAPAKGLGGSADVVAYARHQGKDVRVIWPDGVTR